MYCKYCGYQLPDDAQFCPNCGKQNPNPADDNSSPTIATPSVSQVVDKPKETMPSKSQKPKPTKPNKISSLSDVGQKKEGLFSKRAIIIGAAAAIVVIVGIILAVVLMSGGGQASVYINSNPSGAQVYVGSEYYGETPVTVKLSSDTQYTISVKKDGYDTWVNTINTKSSEDRMITATLTQTKQTSSTSKLYFTSSPSGAQVYINGEYCGDTPTTVDVYANTQCSVSIRKAGYEMWSQTIISSPSGTKTVNAKLTSAAPATPTSSKLYMTSNPSGAQVYIGNVYYGTTPTTVYVSPNMRYTVYFEKSGYHTWSQTITPNSGSKTVSATLSPIRSYSSSTPSSSTLYITSTPSDANVYIDGYYRGETPLSVKVAPGTRYTVSVEKPGYDVWTQTVPTSSSGTKIVNAKLTLEESSASELYITSSPSGATVYLNQDYRGSTPITLAVNPSTEYLVTVESPGYESWMQTVTSTSSGTKMVSVTLDPTTTRTSELYITSNPSGAAVYLDQDYRGSTPYTVTVDPSTQYLVTVESPGYESWMQMVTSSSSGTKTVSATLKPSINVEPTVKPEPTYTPEPFTPEPTYIPEPFTPEPTYIPEPVKPEPTVTPEPTPQPTTPPASKFHITSDPSGAEVYLNDKYSGFTPLTIDVSPGTEYVISIKDSEYEIWEQVVASYQSGTKTVNANLRPL